MAQQQRPAQPRANRRSMVSSAAPATPDSPAMQRQRIAIAQYKSPSLNPTYLYENNVVFNLSNIAFHEQYDRSGVVQDWLYATVTDDATGKEMGVMQTTAVMLVSVLRDVLTNAQAAGETATEVGPLRINKGERAYYFEDVDANAEQVPF